VERVHWSWSKYFRRARRHARQPNPFCCQGSSLAVGTGRSTYLSNREPGRQAADEAGAYAMSRKDGAAMPAPTTNGRVNALQQTFGHKATPVIVLIAETPVVFGVPSSRVRGRARDSHRSRAGAMTSSGLTLRIFRRCNLA